MRVDCKRREPMKKLLSLLVVTVMLLATLGATASIKSVSAAAGTKDVTMLAVRWNLAGYDRYGRPLLDGRNTYYSGVNVNKTTGRFDFTTTFPNYPTCDYTSGVAFPWQKPGQELWGRVQYYMPDARKAIGSNTNGSYFVAVTDSSDTTWKVVPYLWAEVWLTVKAKGGESTLLDKRYIVMDNVGQVWIDPDGRFNDCRYWDPANPKSLNYRNTQIYSGDGTAQWNDCRTNPMCMLDPSGENNTQGPYIFAESYNPMTNGAQTIAYPAPAYHKRVYYWWYNEEQNIDRVWRLGWSNQDDYLRNGAIAVDGKTVSSGIVGGPNNTTPGAFYPGKPVLWNSQSTDPNDRKWTPNDQNILAYDWDCGVSLIPFGSGERYIDINNNNSYDYGEWIFLDNDTSGTFNTNDSRLISYTIQWGGRAYNFRKGTNVGPNDEDVQWLAANPTVVARNFPANTKHAAIPGVSLYDQIYIDNDLNNVITPNDIRMTNINYRFRGYGLTTGGMYFGDAVLMLELMETTCSWTYNVSVESDMWMAMEKNTMQYPEIMPSRTAASFKTVNGDINQMSQLVNKATAIDPDGKTFVVPTTTFHDLRAEYREYLGLQIFLDNGVDNNLALGGTCYQLSLADDHVNFLAGEQYIGSQDVETALDIGYTLTDFPTHYLYFDAKYDMRPGAVPNPLPATLFYGCGDPIYDDVNKSPYFPNQPLQPDPAITTTPYNPGIVNAGDMRMLDVTISSGNGLGGAENVVTYKAGSIVAVGDLDYGRVITSLPKGMTFYDEPKGCEAPNKQYDIGELIYFDPAKAGGSRAIRMIASTTGAGGTGGIETFAGAGRWTNANYPFTGTSGANWVRAKAGFLSTNYPDQPWGSYLPMQYSGPGNTVAGNWSYGLNDVTFDIQGGIMHGAGPTIGYSWPYPAGLYAPAGGILYYNGLDQNAVPATSTFWNSYVFNFDYTTDYPYWNWGYYKACGMAAVLVQPQGATCSGYTMTYFYNDDPYGWYDYSYYGWESTRNIARIIISRANNYTNNGDYARTSYITYYDSTNYGDLFPLGTMVNVQTTVSGNIWNITIPGFGYDIQATLGGATSAGSAGLYQGATYCYYDGYNAHAYWDNLDIYYVESVPQPGDRRRLLAGGHNVGANGYVFKKNGTSNEMVTASTNASSQNQFGYYYPCGTKLAAGELYDVKSKVGMITMGLNGDPRFMDIEVLPGKLTVNIDIDGVPADPKSNYQLKVEQTSDIKVTVDPAPKPGEKYIVKFNDLYQSGVPATPAFIGYTETREDNSFSDVEPGEVEIPKETFSTTGILYSCWSDGQPAGGFDCPQLALPFDFTLYGRTITSGTHIQVSSHGYIRFDNDWYNTYWPSSWYWMQGAPSYTISPLGAEAGLHTGYSPLSGQPVNSNLGIYVSRPTAGSIKIRWASRLYYTDAYYGAGWSTSNPPTFNFSVTLYSDNTIRFSYGACSDTGYGQWYSASVGIKGTGTVYSTSDREYHNCIMHYSVLNSFNWIEDIVLTRTEFPPDPGRPAGGSTDQDYLIGSNPTTKVGPAIGGAWSKSYEITPENPVQHIQYTPYRGSCQEDGTRDPIRIEVFLEKGGVSYPVPLDSSLSGERFDIAQTAYPARFDSNIYDPFWVDRPWSKKQFDERYKGDKTPRPVVPASGIPTFTCGLDDQYDCYGVFNLYVAPEDLKLEIGQGSRACISTGDQRFPNLTLQVLDADNPNDINDPANMLISTTALQPGVRGKLVANVNAHGAGIAYLATAICPGNQNHQTDRYIVQVNTDGSYTFWRWYEPIAAGYNAATGVLDPTDWVYSRRDYDNATQGYIDITGYGTAVMMPFTDSDGFATARFGSSSIIEDYDCSFGKGICDVCHLGEGFPNLGDVSYGDRMGRFNNSAIDNETDDFGNYQGGRPYGFLNTFGVPTLLTNWSDDSNGGEIKLCVQPKNAETPLTVRVYLAGTVFDYNSALATTSMDTSNPTIHPPYFVYDDAPGIDYCGTFTVPVTAMSDLNFSEFRLIDHGLEFSKADYTSGTTALSLMDRPTRQLRHWYNPVVYNYTKDVRCYPGGQSHVHRLRGLARGGGFNSYPALDYPKYNKLGTEFYPLTDYGLFFTLTSPTDVSRTQMWDRWTFDPYGNLADDTTNNWRIIKSIELEGPFMMPMRYYRGSTSNANQGGQGGSADQRLRSQYSFNGIENVPIQYDSSGYLKIDKRNCAYYEIYEDDWTNIVSPGFTFDTHSAIGVSLPTNGRLAEGRDLVYEVQDPYIMSGWYQGENYFVFNIDEIIPIQPGLITLTVTMGDGSKKIFQDCCAKPPTDGFVSHALGIKLENQDIEDRGGIIIDSGPVTLNAVVTEDEKVDVDPTKAPGYNEWELRECNNAVVFAWQDRGLYDPDQKTWFGAGDGYCSGAPKNSDVYAKATQYMPEDDKNKNGVISFYEAETEIIGSYDLATGTWKGAFIDGRTFQRNNGKYNLEIDTGSKKDAATGQQFGLVIGFDFGGFSPVGDPLPAGMRDHVVGWEETLPVWVTAYKYGDDNNDRSFRPLYDVLPGTVGSMSHEVYLAGTRKFDVMSKPDLQFTYGPEPLTAGFTPELQNVDTPLTFTVLDDQGKPIDLTHGIMDGFGQDYVKDEHIWNQLFVDPHSDDKRYFGVKAELPQYYWVRTDLHNFDGTVWSNGMQYSNPDAPFTPITFDSDREHGKYKFYGFCANDAGEFPVYVYTPDRRHCAMTTVKVKQPHAEYKIRNLESTETFSDKGAVEGTDPDFVMTACDERMYEITVKVWDALGQLIKGTAKEVSVCSGSGSDTTRFTAYVTRPRNFDYSTATNVFGGATFPGTAAYQRGMNMAAWREIYWISDVGNRFFPFYGIDVNNDGKIDPLLNRTQEIGRFTFMHAWSSYWGYGYDTFYGGYTGTYYYPSWSGYNTTNYRYDDGSYAVDQSWDIPPNNHQGFGVGSIYNHPYAGGYVFWDLNVDKKLTFQDALTFNQNGETTFVYYADDESEIGGLIGNNTYSNMLEYADVAGGSAWYEAYDPTTLYGRFWHYKYPWTGQWYGTNDGGYRLDWDAIPDNNAKLAGPTFKCYDAETGDEMKKDLLVPEFYDLTYGVRNHIMVKAYPADSRDLKLKEGALISYSTDRTYTTQIAGNHAEAWVTGRLQNSETDPKAVETSIYCTPDGTGPDASSLLYFRPVNWQIRVNQTPPEKSLYTTFFALTRLCKFDVCKGLAIKAEPLNKVLKLGQPDTVIVTVTETGSGYPYAGVKVVMRAEDGSFEIEATTNDQGQATFTGVKPSSLAKIFIKATKEGKTEGSSVLYVEEDRTPPSLDVDPFPTLTNKSSVTITGTVTKGSKVKVGNVDANVDANGAWKANINLNPGENVINIIANGPNGVPRTITIRIILDKEAPVILLPTQAEVDSYGINDTNTTAIFRGRVTPGSKITAADIKAVQNGSPLPVANVKVVNDVWVAEISNIQLGVELTLDVSAVDEAGNPGTASNTYKIAKITKLYLTIGNAIPVLGNKGQTALLEPPFIGVGNNVMVPIADIASYLDMQATTTANSVTVVVGSESATATVGSNSVVIGTSTVTLSTPPVVKNGRIFVPIQLVKELLDKNTKITAKVDYDVNAKTIVITIVSR